MGSKWSQALGRQSDSDLEDECPSGIMRAFDQAERNVTLSSALKEPVICVRGLHFRYNPESESPIHALKGIDLCINQGDYLVIIGHNGSGKSTLAKHLNALLRPSEGQVWVKGLDTRDAANVLEIRSSVGMVFQVPDNQIVATIVEEDVAFGPENLGVAGSELVERVENALAVVGMREYRHRSSYGLSGGQKQRVAIAGVVAMKPEVLVLDEATSMLDPEGRREVLAAVRRLNDQGVTVVAITHFMSEATEGNRVVVMEEGKVVLEGSPRQVFSRVQDLRALQLDVPQTTDLAYSLHQREATFPPDLLLVREVADEVQRRVQTQMTKLPAHVISIPEGGSEAQETGRQPFIQIQDLHHTYLRGTPLEVAALHGVSLDVYKGESLGIIGRAGSGKSTVVQYFNGLMRPREPGKVRVDGQDLSDPRVDIRRIRQKIGLVFQYPEQQLFERLVGDDIAFGPKKLGMGRSERRERVRWAMEMVGLGFDEFKDRFTFSLSSGEMRKVALAGVLALQPEVLVLDESTTGLDPRSRAELLVRLLALHREQGLTLVLVSPSMEDVAELVDRVYVLDGGRVAMNGTTRQVFAQADRLRRHGLGVPQVTEVMYELAARGIASENVALTVAQGVEEIWKILNS
jgi:energy-coupling factor transporter ATPase